MEICRAIKSYRKMKGLRSHNESIWPALICDHQFYGHKWVQNPSILWLNLIAWGISLGFELPSPGFHNVPQLGSHWSSQHRHPDLSVRWRQISPSYRERRLFDQKYTCFYRDFRNRLFPDDEQPDWPFWQKAIAMNRLRGGR